MKEAELRKTMKCVVCQKPILHAGLPLFFRVTVERFAVNLGVLRRQAGLAQAMGSRQLAAIMGPDDDVATRMQGPIEFGVCDTCACDSTPPLAALIERQAPSAEDPPEAIPS